jgi:hypothetical protein
MKRPWLYYITPFILAAVFCILGIVAGLTMSTGPHGYNILLAIVSAVAILLLLGFDYLIKTLTNGMTLYVWIIEGLFLAILLFWFANTSGFRISGC